LSYKANTNHKFLNIENTTMFTYNAWDCHATAELDIALRKEMESARFNKQSEWYDRVVTPLQYAVMDMEGRGIPVDVAKRKQFTNRIANELFQATERVRSHARTHGYSFTDKFPNSDQQVRDFLFNHLGLKPAGRTNKGKGKDFSVDLKNLVSVIKKLRKKDEPHRNMLYALTHRSRLQTVYERYCTFPVSKGRVYPTVKLTGTKTFRYAYKSPALQQFPPETRVFLGGHGGLGRSRLLLAIDYSQLEARILAILAEDEISLSVFRSNEDVHAQNARDLFGMSPTEWDALDKKKRNIIRSHAKGFLYRISYGGEGNTDAGKEYCPCPTCAANVPPTMGLSKEDELAAEARWFAAHSAVRDFQDKLVVQVGRDAYYENPFGVRRYVATPAWDSHGRREILNIPMQFTGACIVNAAQVRLHKLGAPIFLQWHDAFYFELEESAPGRVVDQQIADYKGVMEEPVPELDNWSFPCDAELGYNLGKKSKENPGGLGEV
jgi:DNA polymerase-1